MWLKPQGFAEIISPDPIGAVNLDHLTRVQINSGQHRLDTATCFHCGSVFHVGARQRPEDIGGMCPQCWHIICPRCLDKPCTPWERQMEELENKLQKRQAVEGYF